MNLLERELHYPLGDTLPAPGESLEVAPGVRWVRMRLPFVLDHINLWLLRDRIDGRDGWTVVDCCIAADESRAQWEQVFATQLDGLPVLRVIVTHMHPDHIGLAEWLCSRWSGRGAGLPQAATSQRSGEDASAGAHECPLWISATDYHVARVLTASGDTLAGGEAAADFFAANGLANAEALQKIRARNNYYAAMVPALPDSFVRLMDGMRIAIGGREWQCIAGYGHAPEHMALYCADIELHGAPAQAAPSEGGAERRARGLLIGGDMMLPRISTNVSVHAGEPRGNPLRLFLDSLLRFLQLPAETLVLPSHGRPFTGMHRRVAQLQAHHRERLSELIAACAERPLSAADALPLLFKRPLDVHQTTFAMGESIAHLHLLEAEGRLQRRRGDDGVWRFAAHAAAQ